MTDLMRSSGGAYPSRARSLAAMMSGEPVRWTRTPPLSASRNASSAASGALARLRHAHGDKALGAVISPHLTNEENFRFGQLLKASLATAS